MGLGIALKAFSAALFNNDAAKRIADALNADATHAGLPAPATDRVVTTREPKPAPKSTPKPARSEAITMLSALQRESRLIDLVYENLVPFSDEQVGAAARPCLQQCRKTLDRILSVSPLLSETEGSTIDIGATPSPTRFQRVGDGSGSTVKVIHPGWKASQVQLPEWTGAEDDAVVLAPAQIEG